MYKNGASCYVDRVQPSADVRCSTGGGGLLGIAAAVAWFLCTNLILCSMKVVSCCFTLFDAEAWVFLMCRFKYCPLLLFVSC
jgi:hypothetical protein